MRFQRTASKCKECPLARMNRVWGTSDVEAPAVVFLGEAPGENEDKEKKPFVGAAGARLKEAVAVSGLLWHTVHKTNVICCRPPDNNIESDEAKEAIECCRPGFEQEIAALKKAGAKVVVPLGNTALRAVGLAGNIGKVRGSVYETKGGLVAVPTYHPSFILRGMWKEEPTWIADLAKAKEISLKKWKPLREKFNLFPTVADVKKFCEDAITGKKLVAVDIETTSLSPYHSKIIMIGLAINGEEALVVPFTKKGGAAYWKITDEVLVQRMVNKMLGVCPTMFQNASFDVRHLEEHGYTIGNLKEDTMLAHHCLTGDTTVDTLDFGPTPIRDLVGKDFWVISHDGSRLVPKPAKVCWSEGKRADLVRVVFWCKDRGDKSKMWIDCTVDHEFPVQGRAEKVQAKDLRPGDMLFRGMINQGMVENQRIHRWVYSTTKGPLGELDVHHIDGNHRNNNPRNLLAVTKSQHNGYHLDNRYRATATMMRRAREKRKEKVDNTEVLRLYFDVGLSYREIGEYLGVDPHLVRAVILDSGRPFRTRGEATKKRWEKSRNCRVISVVPLDAPQEVFDLEVPGTHTFSANGVIVGNSIHPELPHNLEYIVSIYGKTPAWKATVKGSMDRMVDMDDAEVRTYNARDTVVLHQIIPELHKDLEEFGTMNTYRRWSMRMLRPLIEMSKEGMLIDKKRLAKAKKSFEKEAEKALGELKELCGVPEGFNFGSAYHLQALVYGTKPKNYEAWMDEYREYIAPDSKKRRDTKKFKELKEKLEVFSQIRPLTMPKADVRRTTTGYALDDEAFLQLQRAAIRRIEALGDRVRKPKEVGEEIEALKKTMRFFEVFRSYSASEKLASTYSGYPLGPDGRVHPSYKIHGTATGRISASEPNLQNQPAVVQDVFVAGQGRAIIKADYSNIELRVLGYITGEKNIMEAFEKGLNIHDVNTKMLFEIDESHPDWKEIRRAAKIYVFGRSYGGGVEGIYKQVLTEVPSIPMTFAHFKECDRRYFEKMSSYRKWVEEQKKRARNTRIVETAFGRKRILLGTPDEIERQALNSPIQGTAGEIAMEALCDLYEEIEKASRKSWKARLVLTVHDSILVECEEKYKMDCAKLMKKVMEKEWVIGKRKVKFPVDIEVGPSWGETEVVKIT